MVTELLLHFCAVLIIGSGCFILISRQVVYAALALIAIVIGLAGIYVWLDATFIALTQVMVYVGGALLIIIWAMYLTPRKASHRVPLPVGKKGFQLLCIIACCALLLCTLSQINFETLDSLQHTRPPAHAMPPAVPMIEQLGIALLGQYLFIFEFSSIVLLITLVGALYIARAKMPTS